MGKFRHRIKRKSNAINRYLKGCVKEKNIFEMKNDNLKIINPFNETEIKTKRCGCCKKYLPIKMFGYDKSMLNGRAIRCKICNCIAVKKSRILKKRKILIKISNSLKKRKTLKYKLKCIYYAFRWFCSRRV